MTKAFKADPAAAGPTLGSLVAQFGYDGLGRRIVKAITNMAYQNGTTHFYHSGQRIVETRNGSDQVLQHLVWGLDYVDELLQTGLNSNEITNTTVDSLHSVAHDLNFNVLGVFDAHGRLVERFDYAPHGQRTVYVRADQFIEGDINGDGFVSIGDLVILGENYGQTGKAREEEDRSLTVAAR